MRGGGSEGNLEFEEFDERSVLADGIGAWLTGSLLFSRFVPV